VVAAIDLHELAQTGAPLAWAVHSRRTPPLRRPHTRFDHPAAQGLGAVDKAVLGSQVLTRQCRAEVTVVLAHQLQHALSHAIVDLAVAAPSSAPRHQPTIAVLAHAPTQSLDLAHRYAQQARRLHLLELPCQ